MWRGAVVAQLKAEAVNGQVVVLDGALDGQLLACRTTAGVEGLPFLVDCLLLPSVLFPQILLRHETEDASY